MEDPGILELFFARSEQAIVETDRKYGGYCYSIAYNILSSKEDSEECVSDTYLAAWNLIPPRKPNFLNAFLGKITRHISIDRWRKKNAQKREPIQIESFRVTPFGAEVRLEAKPGMHAASLDLSPDTGTPIYAVMKDGSQIALLESSQTLLAQSPIVLGRLDHILLADGTVLPLPEQ